MTSRPPSATDPGCRPPRPRRRPGVSLAVLAGVCRVFAVLFFQVVRPLALPLFLAAVFAVMGKWLVLLFVLSMVPMVGPSIVWLPLSAWMLYQRQYVAGTVLVAF